MLGAEMHKLLKYGFISVAVLSMTVACSKDPETSNPGSQTQQEEKKPQQAEQKDQALADAKAMYEGLVDSEGRRILKTEDAQIHAELAVLSKVDPKEIEKAYQYLYSLTFDAMNSDKIEKKVYDPESALKLAERLYKSNLNLTDYQGVEQYLRSRDYIYNLVEVDDMADPEQITPYSERELHRDVESIILLAISNESGYAAADMSTEMNTRRELARLLSLHKENVEFIHSLMGTDNDKQIFPMGDSVKIATIGLSDEDKMLQAISDKLGQLSVNNNDDSKLVKMTREYLAEDKRLNALKAELELLVVSKKDIESRKIPNQQKLNDLLNQTHAELSRDAAKALQILEKARQERSAAFKKIKDPVDLEVQKAALDKASADVKNAEENFKNLIKRTRNIRTQAHQNTDEMNALVTKFKAIKAEVEKKRKEFETLKRRVDSSRKAFNDAIKEHNNRPNSIEEDCEGAC